MLTLRLAAPLAALAFAVTTSARAQEHEAPAAATHEPAHDTHDAAAASHGGPFELRLSLEAPLYNHISTDFGSASTNLFKTVDLGVSVMLSYLLVPHVFSLDAEITESFLLASEFPDEGAPKRSGTTIRLGGSYTPSPNLPLYVTALTTFHLEPSPFIFGLRVGAGTEFHITPAAKYFVELDFDFPLASGTDGPSAFKQQAIVLATGVLFHLP